MSVPFPIVSCRLGQSNFEFGPLAWIGDPPKNKTICLLVHGFNSAWANTLSAYQDVAAKLEEKELYDECVGFFWPGYDIITYPLADAHTGEAARNLTSVIQILTSLGNTVDIQAHSLGNKVTIRAITESSPIRRAILTAAAVPDDWLQQDKCDFVKHTAKTNVVQYSRQDVVLKKAYRIVPYNWFRAALGYNGPTSADQTRFKLCDMSGFVVSHSDYRKHDEFYESFRTV